MSVNTASEIPVTPDDLLHQMKRATDLLKSVAWEPRRSVTELGKDLAPAASQKPTAWRSRESLNGRGKETLSLLDIARDIGKGDELMDESVNESLTVLRRGLTVAFHLASLYAKTSGLESLRERNLKNQLGTATEQAEFRDKSETQAAITVFVLAYYVVWQLQQKQSEGISESALSFRGLPESIPLSGQMSALQATLFHFGSYLKEGGVLTGLDCRKMTQLYFNAVLEEMKGRSQGLRHTEPYIERSYRLEKTAFTVNGFHGDAHGSRVAVEFKRVDINTIVGNLNAKLHAYRIAQALIAYDFTKKMNPMVELGGFPWIYLMKGIPGTGKTLLLGAVLTMVKDYCDALGLPFRPHPLPNTIISTFQGGSAEHMENWMLPLANPNEIILAPVDDAENSFQDRTMQGVSSGVREVIGVFLRRTEGSSAINRGNALFMFATNIPEQMDPAVLSRILAKMNVDGACTREDFLDQMRLWTDGLGKFGPSFIDLVWPKDYTHLGAQKFRNITSRIEREVMQVEDQKLAQIIEEVSAKHKSHEHDFYAALFVRLRKEYPFFSSRDVRNIQVAVGTRMLDFDFPEEWLTKREVFVGHPYETKRGMIVELMQKHMGMVKFHELLYIETLKYVNTMVSILDAAHKRRVKELLAEMQAREEAAALFAKIKNHE